MKLGYILFITKQFQDSLVAQLHVEFHWSVAQTNRDA